MDGCAYAVVDNLLQKGNVGTTVIRHLSLVICSGKKTAGKGTRERGARDLPKRQTAADGRKSGFGNRDSGAGNPPEAGRPGEQAKSKGTWNPPEAGRPGNRKPENTRPEGQGREQETGDGGTKGLSGPREPFSPFEPAACLPAVAAFAVVAGRSRIELSFLIYAIHVTAVNSVAAFYWTNTHSPCSNTSTAFGKDALTGRAGLDWA